MSSSHLPPLRLLSLDGGGVRGLSSLMILKDIMGAVSEEEKKLNLRDPTDDTQLKPCDYFDLIGGMFISNLHSSSPPIQPDKLDRNLHRRHYRNPAITITT